MVENFQTFKAVQVVERADGPHCCHILMIRAKIGQHLSKLVVFFKLCVTENECVV